MSFSVSNGKIIGPNGQPFIAKGTAVYDDVDLPSAVNAFTTTLPGINFIRMTNFNLSEDTVAYLTPVHQSVDQRRYRRRNSGYQLPERVHWLGAYFG